MYRFRAIFRKLLVLAAGLFLSLPSAMAQCAMCRTTIENNVSNGDFGIAAGLNLGILYLFVAPYVVIGAVAFFWYKRSKANAKKISLSSRSKV
jgi:hypothetical protein